MYKHLEIAGEFTPDYTIKMAEDFIGESLAKELKKKTKDEIFLSEDAVSDCVNGTIYTVCINYPDKYKTFRHICFNTERFDTDENKKEFAITSGILEYYSFSNIGNVVAKKMEIPDWVTNDTMSTYLQNERKAYYVHLLEQEYNKRVDVMNYSDVRVSKSTMLDKFNSEDF